MTSMRGSSIKIELNGAIQCKALRWIFTDTSSNAINITTYTVLLLYLIKLRQQLSLHKTIKWSAQEFCKYFHASLSCFFVILWGKGVFFYLYSRISAFFVNNLDYLCLLYIGQKLKTKFIKSLIFCLCKDSDLSPHKEVCCWCTWIHFWPCAIKQHIFSEWMLQQYYTSLYLWMAVHLYRIGCQVWDSK